MRLCRLYYFQIFLISISYAIPRSAGFRMRIPSMTNPTKSKIPTVGNHFASKQETKGALNTRKSNYSTSVEKKSSSLKKRLVRGTLIVVIMVPVIAIASYIYILYIFLNIFGPIADFLHNIM